MTKKKSVLDFYAMKRKGEKITFLTAYDFPTAHALVTPAAAVLTWLADVARRPPAWGLSLDAVRTLRAGLRVEGGRVQRELGLPYTPVRRALEDAVSTIRG